MTINGTIAAGNTITVTLPDKAKAKTVAAGLADRNPGFRFRFISCTPVAFVGWKYTFAVVAKEEKGEKAS